MSDNPAVFARGFIISARPVKPPREVWERRRIGRFNIVHDPRVAFCFAAGAGRWVALLGMVVDVREPDLSAREIVDRAAGLGLQAMLADMDYWAGRFVVLRGDGRTCRVCTDASGMRAVFYNTEGPLVVASHARLAGRDPAAHQLRVKTILTVRHYPRLSPYYPGRLTPLQGVIQLTPNVALNLDDRSLMRFWPRPRLQTAEVVPAMKAQVSALCATGRPVLVSLTAGTDSRLTLAATRDAPVRYFTYESDKTTPMDGDAAVAIAERLRLDHRMIQFAWTGGDDPLVRALRRSCVLSHGHALAAVYSRTFDPSTIHIRSNVSEVGRAFYRKRGQSGPVTAEAMARAWRKAHGDADMVAAFAEWRSAVAFPDKGGPVDPWDLFYMEHRMALWHGNLVQESDIAFDTWSLFNCRAILASLMAPPLAERLEAAHYMALFDQHLPELRDMPINPKPEVKARTPA